MAEKKKGIGCGGWLGILILCAIAGSLVFSFLTPSVDDYQKTYQPLVKLVRSYMPEPCGTAFEYYKKMDSKEKWKIRGIMHDSDGFLLIFNGGSIDIDGSTIYYYSKENKWSYFHNDWVEARERLDDLSKDMKECRIQ